MEGILEGTILFFPSMVQQISTAAFPKMDKEGSAGGDRLDMPKYGDRTFKRGEYLIKAQSRSP